MSKRDKLIESLKLLSSKNHYEAFNIILNSIDQMLLPTGTDQVATGREAGGTDQVATGREAGGTDQVATDRYRPKVATDKYINQIRIYCSFYRMYS